MSTPSRRTSPQLPARVYWVRRTLVLLLVLLVGWLLWRLIAGSDENRAAAPDGAPAASTSSAVEPEASPDAATVAKRPERKAAERGRSNSDTGVSGDRPRKPGGRGAALGTVTTALSKADGTCEPASIRVQPTVAGNAVSGQQVQLQLTLSTTSTDPCRLQTSTDEVLVQVSKVNRPTVIWDVKRCPGSLPARTVTLRPGWQTALTVPWSGRRGDRGCTGLTDAAEPGSYAVQAAVVGGEPARSGFVLSAMGGADSPRARADGRRGERPQT